MSWLAFLMLVCSMLRSVGLNAHIYWQESNGEAYDAHIEIDYEEGG